MQQFLDKTGFVRAWQHIKAYIDKKTEMEIYSAKETRIGTWIDGRPLYRKVYQFYATTTGVSSHECDLGDDANVVFIDCTMRSAKYVYSSNYFSSLNDRSAAWFLNETKTIRLGLGSEQVPSTVYVIIEYTKTTDKATIGIPAFTLFPHETIEKTAEISGFDFSTETTASNIDERKG